jgi:CRISPR/Cas system CMR subunit Cmr6 (Cas7 group RAMP superfamily)
MDGIKKVRAMSDIEKENKLSITRIETRLDFIEKMLRENSEILRNMDDKMEGRLSKTEITLASYGGQLKVLVAVIGALSSIVLAMILALLHL